MNKVFDHISSDFSGMIYVNFCSPIFNFWIRNILFIYKNYLDIIYYFGHFIFSISVIIISRNLIYLTIIINKFLYFFNLYNRICFAYLTLTLWSNKFLWTLLKSNFSIFYISTIIQFISLYSDLALPTAFHF